MNYSKKSKKFIIFALTRTRAYKKQNKYNLFSFTLYLYCFLLLFYFFSFSFSLFCAITIILQKGTFQQLFPQSFQHSFQQVFNSSVFSHNSFNSLLKNRHDKKSVAAARRSQNFYTFSIESLLLHSCLYLGPTFRVYVVLQDNGKQCYFIP